MRFVILGTVKKSIASAEPRMSFGEPQIMRAILILLGVLAVGLSSHLPSSPIWASRPGISRQFIS